MSVTSEIAAAANYTAQTQAAQEKGTGIASKMGADEFMNLMLKQLQYQDPLEPVSNTEWIAQQAQFSQLSATQDMSENLATNNSIMQTLSLVGKEVSLIDPDNATKTITGVVSEAKFSSDGASIIVNSKEYPISLVKSVRPITTTGTNTGTNTNTDTSTATDSTSKS